MHLIVRFLKDESAATAIEYGLIATGIAVAIITVIAGLGTKLKTTFSNYSDRAQIKAQILALAAVSALSVYHCAARP